MKVLKHCVLAHAHLVRYLFSRKPLQVCFLHRQYCVYRNLASKPTLQTRITKVIFLRPEEQVAGPHAKRVVASVTDALSCLQNPDVQLVRITVGVH